MSRTRTPRHWREILDAFNRSDFSQAEFCRRRGLALATFRYHRARAAVREVEEVPQLVELFSEPGPRTSEALRLGGKFLPSSPLTIAMNYAMNLWPELTRYAEPGNGMVEIDNNLVENAIRPTAIGKKNRLFIGHPKAGQRSAIIYTIVENCRLHAIDPLAYLTDVMPRLVDREEGEEVADLLPRQWKAARSAG